MTRGEGPGFGRGDVVRGVEMGTIGSCQTGKFLWIQRPPSENGEPICVRKQESGLSDQAANRGPVGWMLDVLSSVRLGVTLLTALFVYSAVGSAGVVYPVSWRVMDQSVWRHDMVRQWPVFEMTEFEWFHTEFFIALCGLLMLNIVVTTLRRIPLRVINLGVWTIHTGVVVLIIGSVVYFTLKVEGDAPVLRRAVQIEKDGEVIATLPVVNGAERFVEVGGEVVGFSVRGIEAGADDGVFVARIEVTGADGARELVGLEDGVRGVALGLDMWLSPVAQEWFWLKDSSALAVRQVGGGGGWLHREVRGLPRYNDSVGSVSSVWGVVRGQPGDEITGAARRSLELPVDGFEDVLGDVEVKITGYLRYSVLQERVTPSSVGERVDPVAIVEMGGTPEGIGRTTVAAFRPDLRRGFGGALSFRYSASEEEAREIVERSASRLRVMVGESAEALTLNLDDERKMGVWVSLGGTGWEIRLDDVIRDLEIEPGKVLSLAILTVRTPEGEEFVRWAADRMEDTRDLVRDGAMGAHGGGTAFREKDGRLLTVFEPGETAPVLLIAGPGDDDLRAVVSVGGGSREQRIAVGERLEFPSGMWFRVAEWSRYASEEARPLIVPRNQRDRDADLARLYAMVRVEMSRGEWSESSWVAFHRYSFDDDEEASARLTRWEPARFDVPGVGGVEVIFTRDRRALETPVYLDDFILTSQFGGFTGETSSIRDWTSVIRFVGVDEQLTVSTNDPVSHEGWWFFQSFWDPPQQAGGQVSQGGMSFTGLGVGNRHGVVMQLVGGTITVMGMLYAFYVKPILKRRQRERVLDGVSGGLS